MALKYSSDAISYSITDHTAIDCSSYTRKMTTKNSQNR